MDDSMELFDYELDEEIQNEVNTMKNEGSSVNCTFNDLLLKPEILQAVEDLGFESPTEIQMKCIEQAALGIDILGHAPSGMGKTSAFILSTLQQLQPERTVQVLVLCPTRELAYHTSKEYEIFSKYMTNLKIAAFFGGIPMTKDEIVLKYNCPQIVVGTLGRILALIKFKKLDPTNITHFVLDECDQILQNMMNPLQEVYVKLPTDRQVMMFSATLNEETKIYCKKFMRDDVAEIMVDKKDNSERTGLLQYYVKVAEDETVKNGKLLELLDSVNYDQAVIFARSTIRCKKLEYLLVKRGYSAVGIYRTMDQDERFTRYKLFKSSKRKILVVTNIFGRGMDVEGINVVINYDIPTDSDAYLHCISRARRSGAMGTAITFVTDGRNENLHLQKLQSKLNNIIAEWVKQTLQYEE